MKIFKMSELFGVRKPVIAMLHIDYLLGTGKYKGLEYLVNRAQKDIKALQDGGVDGILIENWKEDSVGEFVEPETTACFAVVVKELSKKIKVPFGINVLNNDYKTAYAVAALTGASFVQMDVFVDEVESDFTYSLAGKAEPFEIKVNPKEVLNYAKKVGMEKLPLFVFIQPKHYKLLEKSKLIEESAKQAVLAGVSALLVTKATGTAPTIDLIEKAKRGAGKVPVGIGSGFGIKNAQEYLPVVDFAVVGTSIKIGDITDNLVDKMKVKKLMNRVKEFRVNN